MPTLLRIFAAKATTMTQDINQQEVAERIRFLISNQRTTQADFAKRLGIDPANLSKHLNGKLPITRGLINRISVDMGVSKRWLATGRDLPFAKPSSTLPAQLQMPDSGYSSPADSLPYGGIPIYDIDVTAGCMELSRQFTHDKIIGAVSIPSVSPEAVIVRVNGDSMEPEIFDGSFVAIRRVSDTSCIFWGQIYVIVMDDFRMVKHIRRHPDPSMVILRSANDLYDDMEVPLSKIRHLYLVEAILNLKIQC